MKDGKIDVRSVGITIALAIVGACVGLFDFISNKNGVMAFLAGITNVQPVAMGNDVWASSMGFGAVIICIFFVAIAMFSVRSMA